VVTLLVTLAPVVALKPVAGLHVYVVAPPALSVVELPEHMVGEVAVAVTVGVGLTVTVTVAVFVQPPVVPVTVYVVVVVTLLVTLAPVVALKPVAGLHV